MTCLDPTQKEGDYLYLDLSLRVCLDLFMQLGQHVVAVTALILRAGRLLCMRRAPHKDAGAGQWEALSGRVDHGEDPLEAVRREIVEECGLTVDLQERPLIAYSAQRGDQPMVVVVYVARHVAGEVRRSEEHDDHAWLTPEEFSERCSFVRLVESAYLAVDLTDFGPQGLERGE